MKLRRDRKLIRKTGPTPCGVGGLKYAHPSIPMATGDQSHPVRGGWIEMELKYNIGELEASHPVRGGWIEMCGIRRFRAC